MVKVVIKLLVTWWEHRLCLGVGEGFTRESTFEFGMKTNGIQGKGHVYELGSAKQHYGETFFIVVASDDMVGSQWSLIIKGSLCLLSSR